MNLTFETFHYDKKHRLKEKREPQQSYSFVKAFLQLLYCSTTGLTQNVIDIDNTSRTIDGGTTGGELRVIHPGLNAGSDAQDTGSSGYQTLYADDLGIVVGTGSTAVAVADDNLVTPAAHGTAATNIVHYGCYGLNYVTGASTASFDVERIFRNDSGGTIVVAEIGMYSIAYLSNGTGFGFCILRDVLGATISVLNGEYLKVKYTITVSN